MKSKKTTELPDKQHLELLLSVLAEGLFYVMMAEKNKKSSSDLNKKNKPE